MRQLHGSWGNRMIFHEENWGIVTVLDLVPKQRCSWHKHGQTWNRFLCIRGEVGIKTEKGYTTRLRQGQVFEVEPGIRHEFQTYIEPAIVLELAYVKYDPNDIQRDSFGGSLKESEIGDRQETY